MKKLALLIWLALPLMAQQTQQAATEKADPPAPPTYDQLKLENAQLRLQLAQLKEQLLQAQYRAVQMEKQQAQIDLDAAEKQSNKDKEARTDQKQP